MVAAKAPVAILSDPWPTRTRVRLARRDCAKSSLHGTITGFPTPGMADLVWDEIWEGDVIEVKTASSIQPTYTLDDPCDRLPLRCLERIPIQTWHVSDFVAQYGPRTAGFDEEICYCARRNMKHGSLTGSGSPLENPFTIEDCKAHRIALGKPPSEKSALRLACNRFKELLRATLSIHLNRALPWRELSLTFPDITISGNLLSPKQVEVLLHQDYPRAEISPETVAARHREYEVQAAQAVQDAQQGLIELHSKQVNHEALWRELCRLSEICRNGRPIILLCWCHGHCHTYAIARAVEYLVSKKGTEVSNG